MATLPPLDRASLPADVRAAGPEAQQRYAAGLLFERQLTGELAKQLLRTTGGGLGAGPYAQLLPDALADSLTQAGGLGLARTVADLPEDTTR